MKRAYYYLFYRLYKWYEKGPSVWLSDWKAVISIGVLQVFLILSMYCYYAVYSKQILDLSIKNPIVFIPFAIIFIFNYFTFEHTDIWKEYVAEFDQLPKKKNRIGSWIVFGVVLFVIANLIFSFYLMSQIDWSLYR